MNVKERIQLNSLLAFCCFSFGFSSNFHFSLFTTALRHRQASSFEQTNEFLLALSKTYCNNLLCLWMYSAHFLPLYLQCSVSCGQGIQMRGVECKSTDGSLSAKCDPLTKPGSMQQCSTGIHCDGGGGGGGGGQNKGGGTIIVGSSRSLNEVGELRVLSECRAYLKAP